MTDALVLAGGGVAGIAWELGVLRGLADADPALAQRIIAADLVVGTSAGSSVAAQITSGTPLADLYDAQLAAETAEIEIDVDFAALIAQLSAATYSSPGGGSPGGAAAGADSSPGGAVPGGAVPGGAAARGAAVDVPAIGGGVEEVRRRIGAVALAAPTVEPEVRLAAIAARLPRDTWPERNLLLPAVDAETGEAVFFSRDSGVSLTDAVAASCAVPGVWPPVQIGGRRYMDGGVRSGTNADLAAGSARVLVIQPVLADAPPMLGAGLPDEIARLKPADVFVVSADQASLEAFGLNPLSPATRSASAQAGRAIGRAQAAAVAAFWP